MSTECYQEGQGLLHREALSQKPKQAKKVRPNHLAFNPSTQQSKGKDRWILAELKTRQSSRQPGLGTEPVSEEKKEKKGKVKKT